MTRKFTSEDLLNAMGLKVNDVIQLETGDIFKVVLNPMQINHDGTTYTQDTYELEFKDSTVRMPIMILLNNSYTIIQPKPTLTEDEIRELVYGYFKHKCRWVVCNEDGSVIAFDIKPTRHLHSWGSNDNHTAYNLNITHKPMLQFIKWEDEPYSIEELLGESV